MGLAGLWIGQCVALFLVGVGQYILLLLTNWQHEVEKASSRLDPGDVPATAEEREQLMGDD